MAFQDLVHPPRIDAISRRDAVLILAPPISKPDVSRIIKRQFICVSQFGFFHFQGLSVALRRLNSEFARA